MLRKTDLNPRLKFGTDDFYLELQKEIPEANSLSPIYNKLFDVITNDVKPHLLEVKDIINDVDDIIVEINLAVKKGLPIYLKNPDFFPMSEEEWEESYKKLIESGKYKENERNAKLMPPELRRQSWLAQITRNKISDFRRRNKKQNGINPNAKSTDIEPESIESLIELDLSKRSENPQRDLQDDYNGRYDINDGDIDRLAEKDNKLRQEAMDRSAEREVEKKKPSKLLIDRLNYVFSLNMNPDRLMGFVISNIIIPLSRDKFDEDKRVRRGKPSITSRKLKGKKLGEVFELMKNAMDEVLDKELPDDIYSKLEANLDTIIDGAKKRDTEFTLSAAQITNAAFQVNKKIDKEMESIHAMEEDKNEEESESNKDGKKKKSDNVLDDNANNDSDNDKRR